MEILLKEIYNERKANLSSFVSSLTDDKIKEILDSMKKIEDKKTKINIGIKEKCSLEELEKNLNYEIQKRKDNNIKKTSFEPLFEFEEYDIKNLSDSLDISEIKKK